MFTMIVVGIACLLLGVVLEAKFGAAGKAEYAALKTEVTALITEVRGAKSAAAGVVEKVAADVATVEKKL
jgi:hypothetical protein